MKISITGIEARNKAIKGMHDVALAIKSTIGPFGLNFLLEKGNKVTNDGDTIAAELCPTVPDEFERRGALVAHEGAKKTNEMMGDASSTAWALQDAIVTEIKRFLPNDKIIKAKKTPAEIIKEINTSKQEVLEKLKEKVTLITTKEDLIKSALVATEDEKIAELLGSMQWELGPEGKIIAEETNEIESSIEKVTGIRLDNGFSASHLVTNPEKQTLEVKECDILLTNYTIGLEELKALKTSIFDQLISKKKFGIIFIARAFTSDAIKLCQESAAAGFAIFPINAPYVDQSEIMHDIEAVVGGKFIAVEESSLSDIHITDIGFVKRLEASIGSALVTGKETELAEIRVKKRAQILTKKLEGEKSDFSKKMLESRISQLTNGFAILKVGSQSITNRKRLKDKCDDGVNSVRHALKGGTVQGGGKAFLNISEGLSEDNVLKRPLTCIYDQIMGSAPDGWEISEWVRDPYLVLKCALENACDFAGTFVTTNGIITTENPPKCNCSQNNK